MEDSELLRFAADVCDRLDLTYLVTGSTATIAYGEPRFTNDIDIVLEFSEDKIDEFCRAFPAAEFYLNCDAVREAVHRGDWFNLIHPASGLKIDFIVLTNSEFDQSRLARRRQLPVLDGRNVSFASPEDVILKKMLYYQEGGSPKHIRDIAGVLRVQGPKVDRGYIARWADTFGVADIWRAVREEESSSDEMA